MEPMDVDNSESPALASRVLNPTRPGRFAGTAQVFRSVNTPMEMAHGTQSPFQSTGAPRPSPPIGASHFKSSMAACGASSPFTRINAPTSYGSQAMSLPAKHGHSKSAVDRKNIAKAPEMSSMSSGSLSRSVDLSSYRTIPDSLPNLTPSYPAALFGGLSADDEHVTVWEPATGKTVAGNAAPYRRNLTQWLETHKGWEEKADELKSSKRRAAARRSKQAATNFAALCAFSVAKSLSKDAIRRFRDARVETPVKSLSDWSPEDYVRLQEILFRVGQESYSKILNPKQLDSDVPLPADCWERVGQHVGSNKRKTDVVYLAHHILEFGIQKSTHELHVASGNGLRSGGTGAIGIPGRSDNMSGQHSPGSTSIGSVDGWRGPGSFGANSLPNMASGGLSAITNSFRTPKEPRITVWHPDTGKTISGNAAPCRRNLEAWMAQHPGWVPKSETQLSSARRSRNKKTRPMSVPNATAIAIAGSSMNASPVREQSPLLDAVQGLLGLGVSAGSYNSNSGVLYGGGIGKRSNSGRGATPMKKGAVTSSVSSSSGAENDIETSEEEQEDVKMDI